MKLLDIQKQLKNSLGNAELKIQEKEALAELVSFSAAEEAFLKQKSRIQWVAEGDQNTAYFHRCVKDIINRNKILSLTRVDNSKVFEVSQFHSEAISYFSNILNDIHNPDQGDRDFNFVGGNKVSPEQASDLTRAVSREEVK